MIVLAGCSPEHVPVFSTVFLSVGLSEIASMQKV